METTGEEEKSSTKKAINYYVIVAICISVLLFAFANSIEPQIDYQLNFFNFIFNLAYAAPAIFAFFVARKLWGSRIFGRSYTALAFAYGVGWLGDVLYNYFAMYSKILNPYPYYPDIFFASFYPLAIYHLRTNARFAVGGRFTRRQKMILILLPLGITSIYCFGSIINAPNSSVTVPGSVPDLLSQEISVNGTYYTLIPRNGPSTAGTLVIGNSTYGLIPVNSSTTHYPQIYDKNVRLNLEPIFLKTSKFNTESVATDWKMYIDTLFLKDSSLTSNEGNSRVFFNGFFAGTYYVAATTEVFAWVIVGAQVFRRSVKLGSPWALLVVGLGLNSIGDVSYYFTSIYSYDRTNPIISIWVLGFMIVCYGLYLHWRRV